MKKITITGTKGKTTVSSVLATVLRSVENKVLNVDTNGAYINGKLVMSKSDSQLIWDVVPTVAPGRFLYLLHDPTAAKVEGQHHGNAEGVAVLESSLGSGTLSGLAYYGHDVGVFTNVFEDHLGSRPDLNNRADIGRSKSFVFSRINRDGYAVFNADDDIICDNLIHCKEGVTLIPFGLDFNFFNIAEHLKKGGKALTIKDDKVVLLDGDSTKELFDVSDIVWTFNGKFIPSVYNLLAVTGALIGYGDGEISQTLIQALIDSRLDPYSGRLTLLRNAKNVTILADYAHEKQSLKSVADLAQELKKSKDNKVIGVLRLAWDRTEELIEDTARYIAPVYDSFVIYDKIDGFWRQPSSRYRTGQRQFTQEVGRISKLFADELIKERDEASVVRIIREDEAIAEAAKQAQSGDVVVFIVNDDIKRSIDFIKTNFNAEFV